MIKVNFRILIQRNPDNPREWIELSYDGLLPVLPPIGTMVFIQPSNLNFMVDKILMTAVRISEPEKNAENRVSLLQIKPATRKMTQEEYGIISEEFMEKGWVIGDLADNTREALFGK